MRLWSGGRRPLEGPSTAKRGVGAAPEGASMRLWSGGRRPLEGSSTAKRGVGAAPSEGASMRSEGSGVACLYSEALRRIQSSTQRQGRTLQMRQRSEKDRAAASNTVVMWAYHQGHYSTKKEPRGFGPLGRYLMCC
jgi:hypothetical protein